MEQQAVKSISVAIAAFMEEQKITREQMANMLGMSANSLRWKREGKKDWSWSEILALSDLTGKTPDELAGITKAIA